MLFVDVKILAYLKKIITGLEIIIIIIIKLVASNNENYTKQRYISCIYIYLCRSLAIYFYPLVLKIVSMSSYNNVNGCINYLHKAKLRLS